MYDYTVVDGQYILTRNFHLVKSVEPLTKGGLIKSFLLSLWKLCKDVPTNNLVVVWDKTPYHREEILKDYKGNRMYSTTEDLNREDITEEEREKIKKDLEEFQLKTDVKYFLVNNSNKLGYSSLIFRGYEADDLAFMCARELPGKICLASTDSDWKYLITENSDHYNLRGVKTTFKEVVEKESGDVEIFLHKSIFDSLYGSHNFLKNVSTTAGTRKRKLKPEAIISLMQSGDYSFTTDKDLFLLQFKSFDIKSFPDYGEIHNKIKGLTPIDLENDTMTESEFSQMTINYFFDLDFYYFNQFLETLRKRK